MNLFQELKRRKVLKTIGVHATASLIIIQVADIVFPRLFLPDWTVTFVIALVILGFPITFFLSWNYDITKDDQKKPEEAKPSESIIEEIKTAEKSNLNIFTITGAILGCVGIGFWFVFSTSSLTSADENFIENSIAVFSFEDRSLEDKKSNVGMILQDLIISDLSGLTRLKVISSQRLYDIQKQMGENKEDKYAIAQMANAKVLLSGSIMELSGKKILVGDLIDAINGNVIISHRIEGEEIYSMVDELTANIHKDLGISSTEDDEIALDCGEKTSNSINAYDRYLEGLEFFNNLDYENAIMQFQEANKIDPTFFNAHYYSAISQWWLDDSETNQEAANYCKDLIDNEIFKDKMQKLKIEGAYYLIKGDHHSAQPIYEKLVEIESDDKMNWYALGETYYHRDKEDDEEKEKYLRKADAAFKKALELDPDFSTARVHIVHMQFFSGEYQNIIDDEIKLLKNNEPNFSYYKNLILSYEAMEDSINANKLIKESKLNLTYKEMCELYVNSAFFIGNPNPFSKRIENMTRYQQRKAVQYLQDALTVCDEEAIHPNTNNQFALDVIVVILSLRAYDIERTEKVYENIINTLQYNQKDEMTLTRRIGKYMLNNDWLQPYEDIDRNIPLIIHYFEKSLSYAKELNNKDMIVSNLSLILEAYDKINKQEYAMEYFYKEIRDVCGSENYFSCLKKGDTLGSLASGFYGLNNYDEATKIYQYLADQANLISLSEGEREEALAHLPEIYYRLGLMHLKTQKYYLARQNFISGVNTIKDHKEIIEKVYKNNWVKTDMLNFRIGECYFRENNYINAINYFKEAYLLEKNSTDKIEILTMQALSEYFINQIDSSRIHFAEVEKYFRNETINYNRASHYTYIDFPLYKYYHAKGNTKKAQEYLTEAYNHIPENERAKYFEDDSRSKHLHKYYYIHEIIETYNQSIR
jgi:tetratricopeptide (TPR) repeat protein